jgi:3'(2'), 5'-bisphosphate nucleotidase
MNAPDYAAWLDTVRGIAEEAAHRILEVYRRDFSVASKQDGSPLTEADRAAHREIVERLRHLTPRIPVLSEESATVAYDERRHWHRFWLVDPLDGTREFVNRNGEFTVNIALIDNGAPVLGVVKVPVSGASYYACHGVGAFRVDPDGNAASIRVHDYRGGRMRVVASRSHRSPALEQYLACLGRGPEGYDTVAMGSSLKFCLVAEGSADVYPRLGPTSEWDTAAAQCVVECAGGRVVDAGNRSLVYNKPEILNPGFVVSGGGEHDWLSCLPARGPAR